MIYRYEITTPANTAEASRIRTILPLTRGILHQLEIIFPPGPAGLTHIVLNRGLHQIFPTNRAGSFASDNEKISFREHHEIFFDPFELEAFTWNDDDTFEHSIIVRIGILPRKNILRRLF